MKEKILMQNQQGGHFIHDKRIDVKSADDYQGKMGGPNPFQPPQSMIPGMPGFGAPPAMRGIPPVPKPNPYPIIEAK